MVEKITNPHPENQNDLYKLYHQNYYPNNPDIKNIPGNYEQLREIYNLPDRQPITKAQFLPGDETLLLGNRILLGDSRGNIYII
ncbi:MAG: hypothetical protein KatS3mg095_0333 [Candidatus Parcubacteria bacterium]|nr:MAG: hypothetical protein KatS3mg095_0333 [Candidatus Parcubacteria bacterium]